LLQDEEATATDGLKPQTRAYIVALASAALGLLAYAIARASVPGPERLIGALILTALVVVSVLFPLNIGLRVRARLTLETGIVFAAVLLFEPGVAMLIALLGSLLGYAILRRPREEAAFNASQIALQAGAGSLILALAGWSIRDLTDPAHWLVALLAAAAMYVVNTASVSTIIGIEAGERPWRVWRRMAGFDAVEHPSQLALGFLAAVIADEYVLALPLLLLPAYAIYNSLDRQAHLHGQTVEAVESLADIVDVRDPYTANHSRRVADLARRLAVELGLDHDEAELVGRAARVHDIGKLAIDASVLAKPGPLTDEEWRQVRQHPITGVRILQKLPLFAEATSFVRSHHERIDGGGYPDGLRGEKIPLGARIIAVADSYDVMANARPYRGGLPTDVIRAEMERHRGVQWDARAVDALLRLIDRGEVGPPARADLAQDRSGALPPST
jgi:putative nucleotidyltransferase with HDIG domain